MIMKPDLYDSFVYADKLVKTEWFDVTRKSDLPDLAWQQVYAVGNLDGKVPVVMYEDGNDNLPGGKFELDELIEEALLREIREELNCHVLEWEPIGYQRCIQDGCEDVYQLRVYAKMQRLGEFESDPGGSVIGHKLVDISELNNTIGWGKIGARIQDMVIGLEQYDSVN